MRTDLASMNAGKAIAQGSHASNQFVHEFHARIRNASADTADVEVAALNKAFYEWENSTPHGFGTVLVLGGKWEREIVPAMKEAVIRGYTAGFVFDPTYPLVDGEVVHHIPLHTCAYVFVPNKEEDLVARSILGGMNLHP